MAERLPALIEAMCQNEQHRFLSEDEAFRMNTTGSYRVARVTLDKHYIKFKLHEIRNIMYILYMIRNQLLIYTEALSDVHSYVKAAMASENFVEPNPTASPYVIYRQLFEELKSPCSIYLIKMILEMNRI